MPRILIVDDEPDILENLAFRFQNAGYTVDTASDGNIALSKVRQQPPDIIIMDVMMPKVDGNHVCRLLKFDSKYKNIPIIILTARTQGRDMEISNAVGADAFFTKPYDGNTLLNTANTLIKSHSSSTT